MSALEARIPTSVYLHVDVKCNILLLNFKFLPIIYMKIVLNNYLKFLDLFLVKYIILILFKVKHIIFFNVKQ